ncbi:TcdA/TcdB catalytic glycosyltransferase domain-containing protein [Legionella waltersii]|uniref:Glycosyltransferase n=1 Tax=Legionella waltersii TaxID=66969 RepID=A0A0W1ALQ8_9GAMM|nr:TcdA/TcdB catalytic glycosyltransferase domain-containing protein [Legionella waltersii]KTD82222.1 glycosyltransferase [Legionella waltersii]SNV10809.1 glycosyltransferase [Legionella waltersii]
MHNFEYEEHDTPHALTVPPKIHFVWVGGPIREKYLRTIMDVAMVAKRSGFEINLWVDNDMNYVKTSAQEGIDIPNLRIRNVHELEVQMQNDPFYEGDRYKKFWEYVNRERVGFRNLAAAADFFRFEILRQEGGYYFDTDIVFCLDENSRFVADEIPFGVKAHVDLHTGVYESSCVVSAIGDVNNDIIAAVPYHEVMEGAIQFAMEQHEMYDTTPMQGNFRKKFGAYSNIMDAKRIPYQSGEPINLRRAQTIQAGPGALRDAMQTYVTSISADDFSTLNTLKVGDSRSSVVSESKKPIMGVEIISKCDKTWLMHKRKAQQKAFDTDSIAIEPALSRESGEALREESELQNSVRKEQFIQELKEYMTTKKEELRQALDVKEKEEEHDSKEKALSKHFKTRSIEVTKGFSVEQKIAAVEKLIKLLQEDDQALLLTASDYSALTSSRLGKIVEKYEDLLYRDYIVSDELGDTPF